MPRRPTRHRRRRRRSSSVSLPFTFSSFGRLVASAKRQSKQHLPESSGVEFTEEMKSKDKIMLSESSGEEGEEEEEEEEFTLSESSGEEEGEENEETTVQADFAFFDPKPDDFHGVKMLLQNYLDDKKWDLSGFIDLVIGQTTVGTVVKIEDSEDEAPFSVVTALNFGRYKDHKCIMEIKEFLLKVCPKDITSNLRVLLEEDQHSVGLLVSQRVVNLPPQLLPPLYDALFDEVSWATEDEPTEELRKSFRFKFYLIATKIYKLKSANKHKGTSKGFTDDPIIYIKAEDEILHKLSSWSYNFALHTEQPAAQELRNYSLTGLFMAVEAKKISIFRQELHSLINGP